MHTQAQLIRLQHILFSISYSVHWQDGGKVGPAGTSRSFTAANVAAERERGVADTTTVVTFTVMLWYTPQFYALFASDADMHKFIDLIFEETNQGYINSEIPIRIAKHEVLEHVTSTLSSIFTKQLNKLRCQSVYNFFISFPGGGPPKPSRYCGPLHHVGRFRELAATSPAS